MKQRFTHEHRTDLTPRQWCPQRAVEEGLMEPSILSPRSRVSSHSWCFNQIGDEVVELATAEKETRTKSGGTAEQDTECKVPCCKRGKKH